MNDQLKDSLSLSVSSVTCTNQSL